MTGAWRPSSWVNDINPINWKTIFVAWMQAGFLATYLGIWIAESAAHIARHEPVDFHPTTLDGIELLLASLSGITLAGKTVERTTDYGYVERKNAGKVAVAQAAATAPLQVVATGDNTNVNATQPAATDPQAPAARRRSTAQQALVADDDDRGLG